MLPTVLMTSQQLTLIFMDIECSWRCLSPLLTFDVLGRDSLKEGIKKMTEEEEN